MTVNLSFVFGDIKKGPLGPTDSSLETYLLLIAYAYEGLIVILPCFFFAIIVILP